MSELLGLSFSTSLSACIIEFSGGPYDGRRGLYDNASFDAISFCSISEQCTHEYVEIRKGVPRYKFNRTYSWVRP